MPTDTEAVRDVHGHVAARAYAVRFDPAQLTLLSLGDRNGE